MQIEITYITGKTKHVRTNTFIRENEKETLSWFKWRYGHKIMNVRVVQ